MSSQPRPVVKFSSPTDIVGVVPLRVGFVPTESIVVVCLHGPRRRAGLVMRHDLVPIEQLEELADVLAWHVRRAEADGVILVVYTDAPDVDGSLPQHEFVDDLVDRLGIEVVECLLVRQGRWWSYSCALACCPPEGTPIPSEPQGPAAIVSAAAAFDGRAVLADRAALEASIRPRRGPLSDGARMLAFDQAAQAVIAAAEDGADALTAETMALLESAASRWAAGERDLAPVEAARIVLGLSSKWCRDYAATLALDLDDDAYLSFLTELCQRTDDEWAAPVCTVLAWVAYAHGDGALANVAVDRALAAEPDYEMARLLLRGLQGQMPPAEVRALLGNVRRDMEAIARGETPSFERELARRRGSRSRQPPLRQARRTRAARRRRKAR
ncbi:MAG TPA: DUF4192 domain-containing protein [Actinomycetes bacterium]|nr:DUF4192 domain-containing protein [Actinomycetes bacterium]